MQLLGEPLTPAARRAREDVTDPVVRVVLERAARGGRPGRHDDGHRVALAVEGGGHGGVVSAGMCVVLEALGLVDAFDEIYGASSGALNGSFTAAGQAALGATNYEDTANREFADPRRLFSRRPVIDFPYLFDHVIRDRKPYAMARLAAGPAFRAVAVALDTGELEILDDFTSAEELMHAVRVSCSLPVLSGEPVWFRGRPMTDGALLESVPYPVALRRGATHVLVLRSRPAGYRKRPYAWPLRRLAARTHPALAELVADRHARYNRLVQRLEHPEDDPELRGRVRELAPDPGDPPVRLLERSPDAIRAGLQAGAAAAAMVFGGGPASLLWQPRPYLVAPRPPM